MKRIASQEEEKAKYFCKFQDMHFNQKEEEVISLSLFKMKNVKINTNSDGLKSNLQKIDKLRLPLENKIELFRGFKESLEQKLNEEKQAKQRLNIIRKMQIKQERLELQNSIKKRDSNKDESLDSPSQQSPSRMSPKKDNKKCYEEITNLVKVLTTIEKDLVRMKSERNRISEELEDVKYDVIDGKAIQQACAQEIMRQDQYVNQLRNHITMMSQQGLCTPKEYSNNLNSTRLNQTRLNATIIDEVKFKLENVKDFLKDAYSKIKSKKNTNGNNNSNNNNQPQNTNRILSGLDLQ